MAQPALNRLLPLPAVMDATGFSRPTIYRKVAGGEFPKPIKIGRASRWPESAVQDWIARQIAADRAA